ncbi:hypothetical protein HMPREF9625_01317 [Oribacterium parvum ACB1]|uniref:Methyltransferase domain-containing protein n=1 Tax=Oribacterium parvum ACB1 TaxID=796943 RepID=G9WPN4_9FIRM|nr:hypothetical protein HMPREF9625_01317 [Oribacterium parvum ACB1]EJF12323.1 methyltransferase domain protein [Oribacterium parvum ACB8]
MEIVPEAIENAKKNAEKNGLHNAEFFVGAAEEVLPKWVEEQKREGKDVGNLVDVVSLAPPEKDVTKPVFPQYWNSAPSALSM